jgi:hypothetical protein
MNFASLPLTGLRPSWFLLACLTGCSSSAAPSASPVTDASSGDGSIATDSAPVADAAGDAAADTAPDATADSTSACPVSSSEGGADAACNAIAPAGPIVEQTCNDDAAAAPAPAGGTVADGTYVLTGAAFYGSPCPPLPPAQYRATKIVCGGTFQQADEAPDLTPDVHRWNATYATMGTNLTFHPTCGNVPEGTDGYDATPTQLVTYQTSPGQVVSFTWTKQ